MSIHIGAKEGQIARTVLMPGDPLRAKHIAENLLEDAVCFNEVRGMLGYTGTYHGKRVSVMGSGMGIPSISIYVTELVTMYGVKSVIRIGTCGGMQTQMKVGDIVLALAASTDSHINRLRFGGMDYTPVASFPLLLKAYQIAVQRNIGVLVGPVLSGDTFYGDDPNWWKIWADYGILAAEMETAGLYTLAAKHKFDALAILTVSDNPLTGEEASAEARQTKFMQMVEIALETAEGE
ncbi:MAG: purine-nucleoside phosphorylase [Anaerolineaceae bacterium]